MKYKLAIDGVWNQDHIDPRFHNISDKSLDAMDKGNKSDREMSAWLRHEIVQQQINPMATFLPHGVPYHRKPAKYAGGRIVLPPSQYPMKYRNDGVGFLNDWENDYVMLKAPRKTGKSLTGAVKMGLLMLDCDESWPIFSQKERWMVQHREFEGPKICIVASFSWSNVAELWEAYKEAWPREELGPYSPDWGKFPGETGKGKNLAFGDGRPKDIRPCKSGGRLIFLCYSQAQAIWENFKADAFHSDEQSPLNKLNAFEDGSRTRGDYTPVFFTWSGFALPERPDTGLAGPMAKMWSGKLKRGSKKIGRYNLDVPSTPDSIISKKKKGDLYDLYANPRIERDLKTERRGLAVYYPGDEPGAGLCFGPDVWQREYHVIDPLWDDDKTPAKYTKWRVIDYCDKKTTACPFFAVGPLMLPNGKRIIAAFMYRLMYETDILVKTAAERIIEMSHNVRERVEDDFDEMTSESLPRYKEIQCKEEFYSDLIDSRMGSMIASKATGELTIDMFARYGLSNIVPASGKKNGGDDGQISLLKDWMQLDYSLPHPFLKDEHGKPKMGCPRLFLFDGRCEGFVDEIEGMPSAEKGNSVMNLKFTHDAIDATKYFFSDNPVWAGSDDDDSNWQGDGDGDDTDGRTPETGY